MNRNLKAGTLAALLAAALFATVPGAGLAAEHGGMAGMKHGSGGGTPPPLDMMKMGDKVYEGKMGGWTATVRLMDMKAHMASMPGGMKMEGQMPNTHHIAVGLTNPKTKKPVTEGSGSVIVTGPDGKSVKTELMSMQGHFGVDVNLPKPGKYGFKLYVFSGGAKGNLSFAHTVK
jgi:hypothetical protein